MRMPDAKEDLVDKVCVSSTGRIAVVTGRKTYDWGEAWVGVGFDGKGTWCSSNPCVAYESVGDFREVLSERFGGKMSYLD